MPALPSPSAATSATQRSATSFHRVATSDSPRQPDADLSHHQRSLATPSSRALAYASPSSLATKLEQVELLSQPSCPLDLLRTAAPILDSASYDDCCEERHMEGLCPYPPCGNPPSTAYTPEANRGGLRMKLKSDGGLYGTSGSGAEGIGAYCSKECRARSMWYKGRCVGSPRTELLEDVEERRKEVARSAKELKLAATGAEGDAAASTAAETATSSSKLRQPPLPEPTISTTAELLSILTIKERPTPSSAPSAPSQSVDFERPLPSSSSSSTTNAPPTLSRQRPPPSRAPLSAPSSSALLPFDTSSMTNSLFGKPASTRAPPPNMPPISDALRARLTTPVDDDAEVGWSDEEAESEEVRRLMDEAMGMFRSRGEEVGEDD